MVESHSEETAAHEVYGEVCWQRFLRPRHAGPPPAGLESVCGQARGRADDSEVWLWLSRQPRKAWFQAHGSPWIIAAADLAAEAWQAGEKRLSAATLASRLDAPPDVMDAFLTVEDAWHSALKILD
ncbi:hypothetical protein VCB98_06325 [Gammaproteobacteria bacterium AB-CW1]|uniref:Uncharacterized protein n=1 Tax=Natronospira elongata TaxID=3110268 RepID=A0AAP6JF32_9GAMM|nr:hypothetical protein [Gammaproteobacteria bacterium AB-CW1]